MNWFIFGLGAVVGGVVATKTTLLKDTPLGKGARAGRAVRLNEATLARQAALMKAQERANRMLKDAGYAPVAGSSAAIATYDAPNPASPDGRLVIMTPPMGGFTFSNPEVVNMLPANRNYARSLAAELNSEGLGQ